MIEKDFKAVLIDPEKCKGCINCMKKCPTEAIRVRDLKAHIIADRCVSCGECIRICPNRAKYAKYDSLDIMANYKYKVALPPPSLFGQFANIDNPSLIIEGLKMLGFDDVFEVARGADVVTMLTKEKFRQGKVPKPCISTACPVCVELILMRFHSLNEYMLDILPPVDISAKLAREQAILKTGLKSEDIGVFFISPCPAKVAAIKTGFSTRHSYIDGVFATKDICFKLMSLNINQIEVKEPNTIASTHGVGWAISGGESANIFKPRQLAADGIENVISVLKEVEDGKLKDIDFIELNACPGGCVGGILNIENPFVAKSKINMIRNTILKHKKNEIDTITKTEDFYTYSRKWETVNVMRLDPNFDVAFEKMQRVETILSDLPGIDCGVCGAPSCRAFAEDVVNGVVDLNMCVRSNKDDSKKSY